MAERKQRKSEGKIEIVGEGERGAAASAPVLLRDTERQAERVREIERERGRERESVSTPTQATPVVAWLVRRETGNGRGRAESRAREGKRDREGGKEKWLSVGRRGGFLCGF
ncbi:hypothetical protein MRB53_014213 [Persea americana]|uniref:Uncharacterized protein n=1 Tax=Persea americana TaxID=3435 RepID=A0ACC2KA91_PERAE|nr:hypothetical protein MRB53_014213 [Persea americana]